jgi:uncharacterized protein YjdB
MEVNNKGLSIIEIIITIAILGMVAIIFVQIFTVSFQHIMTSGEESKELIENQMDIESDIGSESPGLPLSIDMNSLYPSIYTSGSKQIDGVVLTEGAFSSFLPGVSSTIIYVTNMTLSDSSVTLSEIDDTYNITVSFTPIDATNQDVTWSSDDPGIVQVQNGLLTAVSEGSTTIRATVDGTDPSGSTITRVVLANVSLVGGSDATLSEIRLDGTMIPGFSPTVYSYDDEVNGNNPPDVTFETTDINATVIYTPATDSRPSTGENVATIEVTSADGNTTLTYIITFTKK